MTLAFQNALASFSSNSIMIALVAACLAGFSRGFATFGAALIFIPLMSSAFDVKTAVVTLFLVDLIPSVPYIYGARRKTDYRDVITMGSAAAILTPLGVLALQVVPESVLLRAVAVLLIAIVVFNLFVGALQFQSNARNRALAGGASGLIGGAVGLYGPPAMIYLLGVHKNPVIARSTAFVFLSVESLILGVNYLMYGMYTLKDLEIAGFLVMPYGAALFVGAGLSNKVAAQWYRRIIFLFLLVLSVSLLFRTT
jgi:uncharacterized protein